MKARVRLHAAEVLLDRPAALTANLWPQAVAILGRQALEAAVRERLSAHVTSQARVPFRALLLCLPQVVDPDLARQLAWSWAALSTACHHRGYELPPTQIQLRAWLEPVQRLVHVATGTP